MGVPIDITGKRFGHLVAIRPTGKSTGRGREWECKCDCGNTFYCTPTQLNAGNNVSCGCRKQERTMPASVRHEPFYDCVSFRQSKTRCHCSGLTEMFCVTRGKCKFYTPTENANVER